VTEEIYEHLQAAKDALEDAQVLLNAERWDALANRTYYAMFHATHALLLSHNIERASHKAVIAAFGEFFAKPGLVESRYHRILREAFNLRLTGDYKIFEHVAPDDAKKLVDQAADFVDMVWRQLAPD